MSARGPRLAATRSTLVRQRRRLDLVRKGAALLRRKRESLVNELFARARKAVTSREAIDAQGRQAWLALWRALAAQGQGGLRVVGWPTREVALELSTSELWGLTVVELAGRPPIVRSMSARGVAAAPDEAAGQDAAFEFERLAELLVDAAPEEHAMRRLGQALTRTTRLVNTLEQRVAVSLSAGLSLMQRTLDERELEERLRTTRARAATTRGGAHTGHG